MPLNDIVFNKSASGLGRPLPGEDFISGLIYYSGSLPSGFTSQNNIKKLFAPTDADALGIKGDYNDETQATATYTVTAVGANGDTIALKVQEALVQNTTLNPNTSLITLGTYTKVAADTTTTNVAAGIAAAINANTLSHGYKAVAAVAVVTITARKGLGVYLNTGTPLSAVIVGTIAGTIVQFLGGVVSMQAVWRYHIAEFFRMQPQGILYVGFFSIPGSYTFTEITTMQNFAGGKIRQIGIYKDGAAFAIGDCTAIDTVCKANDTAHKPISGILGADISGTANISTLPDLSTLTANKCSVVIGQDGAGIGAALFYAYGKSITTLGATLGLTALLGVGRCIAWVAKGNVSNGTECDTIAFANGKLDADPSITDSLRSALNNQRFLFLRKFVGISGSYHNDSHTAIIQTSPYAYIENNRTIDKAIRGAYSSLLPSVASPLNLNADGTLNNNTIAYLISQAAPNLDQMVRDGDLSAYQVLIDPTQNVQSTSTLAVTLKLVGVGVARNITVNVGFVLSL